MMEEMNKNYQALQEWTSDRGISLIGVADIKPLKHEFRHLSKRAIDPFDSGISLAVRLSDPILEEIQDRPTQLYFHHYRQANFFLDRVAFNLAQFIHQLGYSSLPIPASQIIDWENQKGHLSHKKVALEAGLGWIGRNNLLVTPTYGARIRLVTILTELPLPLHQPLTEGCRGCKKCIPVCPAGAIKEKQADFDHRACFEQLRLFRKRDHIGQYICGVCVKACNGQRTNKKILNHRKDAESTKKT
jgi:epoxyqueuosine reductase QueG